MNSVGKVCKNLLTPERCSIDIKKRGVQPTVAHSTTYRLRIAFLTRTNNAEAPRDVYKYKHYTHMADILQDVQQ